MAEPSTRKKRRKRVNRNPLFNVGDDVEVKSHEDGFQGSWHPGEVIESKSGLRVVKYLHILDDDQQMLTDEIKVPGVIDGIRNKSEKVHQSWIRPPPPEMKLVKADLHYGFCVDSCMYDAWWEGVIFDKDYGSDCRQILFPELGDVHKIEFENMRITQDWNEVTGKWTPRGQWLFFDIIEKHRRDEIILVSPRQIWFDLRARKESFKLGEWCFPMNPLLWENLIKEVIDENERLIAEHLLIDSGVLEANSTTDLDLITENEEQATAEANSADVDNRVCLIDHDLQNNALMTENENQATAEANSAYSLDLVPRIDNDLQDDVLMTENENEIDSCSEPMALCMIPPQANSSLIVKLKLGKKSESSRNPRESTSKCNWKPYPTKKKNLKPEYCPQSLEEYHSFKGKNILPSLTKKVRQHFLSLGWKMEYSRYGTSKQERVRYYSPKDDRPFYNPRDAVEFLLGKGDNSSSNDDKLEFDALRLSEEEPECLDRSEYCPDSIIEYLNTSKKYNRKSKLLDDAWKDLSAIGWTKKFKKMKHKAGEWRYIAPVSNKVYCSFRKVCEEIKEACKKTTKNDKDDVSVLGCRPKLLKKSRILRKLRNHKRKRKSHPDERYLEVADVFNNENHDLLSSFISKKRKALNKVKSCTDGHTMTRVLRSSKRVRQAGPTSSSQLPKTAISWLIDNDAVVPRSKVFYCKGNSNVPLAEGRIGREGISCNCCQKTFTLSSFQDHVTGNNTHRPAENIFLEDGTSLVSCQVDLMRKKATSFFRQPVEKQKQAKGPRSGAWNDHICSICHYGGELIMCDKCPSSFHANCLNLTDVPEGDWFCPSCCCGVCGKNQLNTNTDQGVTDESILCCHQCERQYHVHCKKDREVCPGENWFCCKTCEKMHWGLQQLLGKPILVGSDNLTRTLVKPMDYQTLDHVDCDLVAMAENYSKLSVALEVMHECFEPVKEPRTKRDLVEDVLFCRGSNLNRLNFKGFYTVVLERNDELITVALLRVYGDKVAEIPLIGTRFQYRRMGMCRVLINEIEKDLMNLGVQKLVLPAAASVVNTWIHSFGFSRVTQTDRSDFLGYTFLDFQDTVMCQKNLKKLPLPPLLLRDMSGLHNQAHRTIEGRSNSIVEHEGNSSVSEFFQEDQREASEDVDQGAKINPEEKPSGDDTNSDAPSTMVVAIVSSNQEGEQQCNPTQLTAREKVGRYKNDGNLQYYKRKKTIKPRSPRPQTDYSKVEVSCR